MTKDAIIEGLRDLTRQERQEVVDAIYELDEELTDEEKRILDERWKKMQEHPETTLSYDELKARFQSLMQK